MICEICNENYPILYNISIFGNTIFHRVYIHLNVLFFTQFSFNIIINCNDHNLLFGDYYFVVESLGEYSSTNLSIKSSLLNTPPQC